MASVSYQKPTSTTVGKQMIFTYEELSQASLDSITHRYQNPWQPKPHVLDMQGKQSRASFAWHMSAFEDTDQRNSKWAILVRQCKSSLPRASKPPKLPKLPKNEKKRKH
uniref:Uncharacterized protein n=1 Tax=Gorilla gorilla gorilla TaxID=9595 RepID=G3QDH8_GORGO